MLEVNKPVTEKRIRERLEISGELGKMRAMIVDAALRAISKDEKAAVDLFVPSPLLKEAKESTQGRQALSIVADYLEYLGLTYTVNVLKQEAGLSASALEDKGDLIRELDLRDARGPVLTTLMKQKAGENDVTAKQEDETTKSVSVASPPAVSVAQAAPMKAETGEDTTYYLSKWTSRVFYRCGGQVSGQQIQLEYLKDCTVYVLDPLDSITVDDCEGGELIIAACEGSVFLRNCKNMTVHVACKQLRTRDCDHITFHIFASTDPVIESSHHMTFKPFHLRLPGLKSSFKAARLDPKANRFVHVYDFTEDDPKIAKPHYDVIFPNHGLRMTERCQEKGIPECPPEIEDLLEGRLAPASSSESGQNKSYNIKTGAHKWTEESTETNDGDEDEDDDAASANADSLPVPSSQVSAGTRPPLSAPVANTSGFSVSTRMTPAASSVGAAAAAPVAVPAAVSGTAAVAAAMRREASEGSYSSFDDDDDNDDQDDELEVNEDSDDF
ncbi:Protein XRP2 [Trypanosoma grayi]|uniref:Protein XRP2 n=1 Tax=Trypanosoma grayi TaxID=71804 RepID=UPI0004F48BAA|nr:Protein XRP2 [Trypanosoma grayi]KEG15102.1 Protein XRP2 [Trypanosoma grayi]